MATTPRARMYGKTKTGKWLKFRRSYDTPRRHAAVMRSHFGGHGGRTSGTWKPKTGRRKLGARRKKTFIQQLFQWIKVPTKVRRTPARRRRR